MRNSLVVQREVQQGTGPLSPTEFAGNCPQALSEKTAPVTGHLSEAREMVLSLKQETCMRQAVLREAVLCVATMRAAHRSTKCSHLERVGKAGSY